MSLRDLTATPAPAIPWRTCSVCHVASKLDDDTRAILENLLAGTVKADDIARHLTDEGHGPVSAVTVTRHWRGLCANGKVYR